MLDDHTLKANFFTSSIIVNLLRYLLLILIAMMLFCSDVKLLKATPEPEVEYTYYGTFIARNFRSESRGTIKIDIVFSEDGTVSGFYDSDNYPDQELTCGAGQFSGTINGNEITFSYLTDDPTPGCANSTGVEQTYTLTLSDDDLTIEGTYTTSLNTTGEITATRSECSGANQDEEVIEVVDGICLKIISNNIYIGIADLNNSDITVELAHEFSNQSQGVFDKKRVKEFAALTSQANSSLIGDLFPSFERHLIAINGTAFDSDIGFTARSAGSILGIDGTAYAQSGQGSVDQPRSSFLHFVNNTGIVERAGEDFPVGGTTEAVQYILGKIGLSQWTVGYRSSLLDTIEPNGTRISGFPAYVANDRDHDETSEKTAIGISEDGKRLFLITSEEGVQTEVLARRLQAEGASRVILLDSSSSTQFASFSQDKIYRGFEADFLLRARPVINAIVVYNNSINTKNSIPVPISGGSYTPSPQVTLKLPSRTFTTTANVDHVPLVSEQTDGFSHVNHFFDLTAKSSSGATLQPQRPFEMIVSYEQANVPIDIDESELALYFWNGSNWEKEDTSVVDTEANLVSAFPNHLSQWGVMTSKTNQLFLPIIQR